MPAAEASMKRVRVAQVSRTANVAYCHEDEIQKS
jgi:hypothetical protein